MDTFPLGVGATAKSYSLAINGAITGTVTDASGAPIGDLAVELFGVDPAGNLEAGQVTTAPDGSYTISDIPFGHFALSFGNGPGINRVDLNIDASHVVQTVNTTIAGRKPARYDFRY